MLRAYWSGVLGACPASTCCGLTSGVPPISTLWFPDQHAHGLPAFLLSLVKFQGNSIVLKPKAERKLAVLGEVTGADGVGWGR